MENPEILAQLGIQDELRWQTTTKTKQKKKQIKMSNTDTIKNIKTGGVPVCSRSVSGSCFL